MTDETPPGSALDRLALQLREARVQRSLSIDEVARQARINASHIEKIETGDFSFIAPLYLFSFLRKYAAELGIEDSALLVECRSALMVPQPPALRRSGEPLVASSQPSSRRTRVILIGTGIFLLLSAILAVALL